MADTEVKQEAAWLKWTGIIVSVIQIILAVSFVGMVFWINIFPVKIEVIIIVVLILLSALALYLQFLIRLGKMGRKSHSTVAGSNTGNR